MRRGFPGPFFPRGATGGNSLGKCPCPALACAEAFERTAGIEKLFSFLI